MIKCGVENNFSLGRACNMKTIQVNELKQKLDRGEVILIDVRGRGEYASQYIEGSYLIPLNEFSESKLPPHQGKIVIHCHAGVRSAQACEQLLQHNPNLEVYNLEGGIAAWVEAGYEVKKGDRKVLPLDRQAQIFSGSLVLLGVLLGFFKHPGFFALAAIVGVGLIGAGISGVCLSLALLVKMPWNR